MASKLTAALGTNRFIIGGVAALATSSKPLEIQPQEADLHEAIGYFLSAWTAFERRLRPMVSSEGKGVIPTGRMLERLGLFEPEIRSEVERIRRLRNNLVHGVETPDPADIREAADRLRKIIELLPAADGQDAVADQTLTR